MTMMRILTCAFMAVFVAAASADAAAPAKKSVKKRPAAAADGALGVQQWAGQKFVLLEKPALYCEYGYELYASPLLDAARGPADTAFFTKYHRARCDVFAGRTLTAVAAAKEKKGRGPEYVMTFSDARSGKKLFAKTASQTCHELAYAPDRDSAEKRWLGKTVFSARGFITDFSGAQPATVKVDLRDSLTVTSVRFGLTPLPAKPLWLEVEARSGARGAIPFCYSWTNTAKKVRHGGKAWEDEVFETSPAVLCEAGPAVWDVINSHRVNVTMTRCQVRMSWGRPLETKPAVYNGAQRECWTYESQDLFFDEHELIGVEERK